MINTTQGSETLTVRHQIGIASGFGSERCPTSRLETPSGFIGIRTHDGDVSFGLMACPGDPHAEHVKGREEPEHEPSPSSKNDKDSRFSQAKAKLLRKCCGLFSRFRAVVNRRHAYVMSSEMERQSSLFLTVEM